MDTLAHVMQLLQAKIKANAGRITLVGIDGPTAVGKTFFADRLRDLLRERHIDCWVFRMDWALKERAKRLRDLEHLREDPHSFELEAELHMNLGMVRDFIEQVVRFNERSISSGTPDPKIHLQGLYIREQGGVLTGEETLDLQEGMVILLEGHYTLRNELDDYLDVNILLLGELQELLDRKLARVNDYRDSAIAEDYFWRIDVPSFRKNIRLYGLNADVIIDNTDYLHPAIIAKTSIPDWIHVGSAKLLPARTLDGQCSISTFVFSDSIFMPSQLKKEFERLVPGIRELDRRVGHYLRTNMQNIEADLTSLGNDLVRTLNETASPGYSFRLTHTDSFCNVYYRRLPYSLSIGLFDGQQETPIVSVITDGFQDELRMQVLWAGGYRRLSDRRMLGAIDMTSHSRITDSTGEFSRNMQEDSPIKIYLPTDFTLPEFARHHAYELIYIRKENEIISPSQTLCDLVYTGGLWVQRFALFSELHFYEHALNTAGIQCIQIGNYLISLLHTDDGLNDRFAGFIREWRPPLGKSPLFRESNDKMDALINGIDDEAARFVSGCCPAFRIMDGHLFSDFMYGDDARIAQGLEDLNRMLLHPNRIVRKRATQFILQHFPLLSLPLAGLWSSLPKTDEKEILLETYNKLTPSIMAEIYLWLAIRKAPSAILGCNIYDIRGVSLDGSAYLEAAARTNSPIVLQVSMNALGQRELAPDGSVQEGYLKLDNGARQFVGSVLASARDLYLTTGHLPPLFGVGLDHVSSRCDHPHGRSGRFLDDALGTGMVTHITLDGESLLDASADPASLRSGYAKMAEFCVRLSSDIKSVYLIDRELNAGELGYAHNPKPGTIHTSEEIRQFMRCYQKALQQDNQLALLSRPMLFIGNLGTTHHGPDRFPPRVELASAWRDGLKGENFVSAVLHGTTRTDKEVLSRAANGCHKINLAGDLLAVLIDSLPENINKIVRSSSKEPKEMIAEVRPLMDQMSAEEAERVQSALEHTCTGFLELVNSPRLSKMDSSYFQHLGYQYSAQHVEVIIEQVRISLYKYRKPEGKEPTHTPGGGSFSPSLIEVPDDEFETLIHVLWKRGIRTFHIDAGDGRFIHRRFSGLAKVRMLKGKYPDAIVHAHLMIENPLDPADGKISPIEEYAEAGCDAIAVHPRAFKERSQLFQSLSVIRSLGLRPGIIIETSDSIDSSVGEIILKSNLDWCVVMGVPIGYGGQIFQFSALQTILNLREFARMQEIAMLIEVDGGLTLETLQLCKHAGADLFAGWSIAASDDFEEIESHLRKIKSILELD